MTNHNEQSDPVSTIRELFSAFNEADFVVWFENGFRSYYSRRPGEKLFSFASHYIARLDSLVDDLEYIYSRLVPMEQQPLFRKAIGSLLLRDVPNQNLEDRIISDLLYLIAKVSAYESLQVLYVLVAEERYALNLPWLQYQSVSVLKALLPSAEAVRGLYNLVTSTHYNFRFSFDILTSLCQHDPQNWIEHLALMSSSIDKLYREAAMRGLASTREVLETDIAFQDAFIKLVPAALILEKLNEYRYALTSDRAYERCIHLIRQLRTRTDSPVWITYSPSHRANEDEYTLKVVIEEERRREANVLITDDFCNVLFKRAIHVRDYMTLLSDQNQAAFESVHSSLAIRPREEFDESLLVGTK